MEKDLMKEKSEKRTPAARWREPQQDTERTISPTDLPFDCPAELGEVLGVELKSPGVYFLQTKRAANHQEVYVVTADAPAISKKTRTYGHTVPGHDGLWIYELYQPVGGWHIIDFEVRRYLMKHHLPVTEQADSLYSTAIYGMEENPGYFGMFPVPSITLRGCTVRHKTIINGVYWLETDRCDEVLAVCYPIWNAEISIPEQLQGEQLERDRALGIENTLGYLFFLGQASCIPLFELFLIHPEIGENDIVDI